jgi:hypothetical protein
MRIQVETGAVDGSGFRSIAEGLDPAGPTTEGALESAGGAAGAAVLAGAMTELGVNVGAALSAARITVGALGAAVDYASNAYSANDARIAAAARAR